MWEWLLGHEKLIRRALARYGNTDDVWTEVVLERLPNIWRLWDGVSNPTPYVLKNLKWYAFKWQRKRRPHQDIPEVGVIEQNLKLEVTNVLGRLSPEDAELLAQYYLAGLTMQELADLNGCSKTTISKRHAKALENAKAFFRCP